ncbi:MAG: hypothetical protein ACYSR9_11325, partial [Planctomycetota bacterium]
MKPEDKIKELINKSDVTTSSDADERILADALEHLEKLKQKNSIVERLNIWRTIMKSPITKLTAAAVIIIACVIGLSIWRITSSGIALADVLARVEQVKAFRCKGSFTMTGQTAADKPYQWEVRHTNLTSQEYGTKVSFEEPDPNGGESTFAETYFFPHKKTMIHIRHTEKKYTR